MRLVRRCGPQWLSEGTQVRTAGICHEVDAETYLRAELVAVANREQEQGFIASEGTDNVLSGYG